jgi:hypothetical protein
MKYSQSQSKISRAPFDNLFLEFKFLISKTKPPNLKMSVWSGIMDGVC